MSTTESNESPALPPAAYIATAHDSFRSTELTRGPWSPEHQHAGPPVALVAHAIELAAASLGLGHIARVTSNLIRPIPIGDLVVTVATDYAGRNAAHFSARLLAAEKEVARFTALAQRDSGLLIPPNLPGHPLPNAPRPPDDSTPARFPFARDRLGYPDLVEIRVAEGEYFRGPCAAWFRLRRPIIEGKEATPIERVAVAADSANGLSSVLDFRRYSFVNNDLTINLLRPARGEWICVDARTLLADGGGGLAEARLFDTEGLIGRATQSLTIRLRD